MRGRHGWQGPRRRPPWWPEGEPFPPTGPPAWGRRRRIAILWVLAFLLFLGLAIVGLLSNLVAGLPSSVVGRLTIAGLLSLAILFLAINARVQSRAISRLVDATARVEAGDLSVRTAVRGPGELRSLARALNAMTARLESTEARRRSFIAEVAHELRTPLAVIRGEAEAIADGVHPADSASLGRIVDASRSLELLVQDLGTLAMSESGILRLNREQVDPGLLLNETLSAYRPAAEAAEVELRAKVAPGLEPVSVDAARLRGVLGNLVANAVRHTPAGGSVLVAAAPDAGGTTLTVRDTGAGIDPELLPKVFDRFVKDPASPGSGLGLAIARDVVTAHGGTIEASNPPGGGALIRLWLPDS